MGTLAVRDGDSTMAFHAKCRRRCAAPSQEPSAPSRIDRDKIQSEEASTRAAWARTSPGILNGPEKAPAPVG